MSNNKKVVVQARLTDYTRYVRLVN